MEDFNQQAVEGLTQSLVWKKKKYIIILKQMYLFFQQELVKCNTETNFEASDTWLPKSSFY